jgi:3-hydroxyisobutyrate dehydrogenase-like beta-hydroxyacid dehydrogenase
LCGGDESVYNEVGPALDTMGKAKFYFGPAGQGSRVKLVVNMIMGTMMSSLSEGMSLASAANLPLDNILQVLDLGAMANPLFKMKGANIINDSYPAHFPLKHAQKDMRFVFCYIILLLCLLLSLLLLLLLLLSISIHSSGN